MRDAKDDHDLRADSIADGACVSSLTYFNLDIDDVVDDMAKCGDEETFPIGR